MIVALHDADKTSKPKPNLALAKLSAWHKGRGDTVEWFRRKPILISGYDRVYSSKVFTYTPEEPLLPGHTIKGGTGYGLFHTLPEEVDMMCPDYSLYDYHVRSRKKMYPASYGFLTRGCPNACGFCIVPRKEGPIRKYQSLGDFVRHRHVVLFDNNILALDWGVDQLAVMAAKELYVDINQGLDARRIDGAIARRLSALKYIRFLRMACDHADQMPVVAKAVDILKANGFRGEIFCYVMVRDVRDAEERVLFLLSKGVHPFAQPYRDFDNTPPTVEQEEFARWCNVPQIRRAGKFSTHYVFRKRAA